MLNLKISTYKLTTGYHVIAYIDPLSKKKIRRKFQNKADAEKYKNLLELKFNEHGHQAFNATPIANLMALHLSKNPNSKVTARKNSFISFCEHFGHFKICDLKRNDLENWFYKIKQINDYSDRTLNHIKSMLNTFFKFLITEEIIHHSPLDDIKFASNPPAKRQRIVLSKDEVMLLLQNARQFDPQYFYPLLFTITYTGARRSEILKLERSNIDFETGLIHLLHTKNGEDRSIRMSLPLKELLTSHLQTHDSEYVFPSPTNKMFGRTQIQRWVQRFKTHYPMQKDWGLHSLRHSFAFNFLNKGGEMYQLQAILGHKTIGMTVDLYGQIKAQDIKHSCPYID